MLTGTGGVLASGEAAAAVAYARYSNLLLKNKFTVLLQRRAAETAMKYVRNAGSFKPTTSETVDI